MGVSGNQIIVFIFFGEKYLEQFRICSQTIPESWNVAVITDVPFENIHKKTEQIIVPKPEDVYKILAFRKYIPDFIKIKNYSRVWFSDVDILFRSDILAKYAKSKNILLAVEQYTSITNPWMSGGFTEEEIKQLETEKQPAINGGFFSVPKNKYDFFIQYKTLIDWFSSRYPTEKSIDQWVLNNMYHRKINEFKLFTIEDFSINGDPKAMVNHYVGMFTEKIDLMKTELMKL